MEVPFTDLKGMHKTLKQEILSAWEEILETTRFVGGPHVERCFLILLKNKSVSWRNV